MDVDRVREARLRRAARRQGLELRRNRVRDPLALGYGRYLLASEDGGIVFGLDARGRHSADLDAVEDFLRRPRP